MTQATDLSAPVARSPLGWLTRRLEQVSGMGTTRADLLSRSLLLEEVGPPAILKQTVVLLSLGMAAFLAWAAFLQIDEIAAAQGQILPRSSIRPVQHREGGIVAEIMVRDGQRVAPGTVLARLVDSEAQAALRDATARHAALSFRVSRLKAFLFGQPLRFDPAISGFDDLRAEETAILHIQQTASQAKVATASSSISQAASQSRALSARATALQRQVDLTREELQTRRTLFEKGYATKVAVLAIERNYAALQGDLAETLRQREGANAATAGAGSTRTATGVQFREEAMADLTRSQEQLSQVTEQLTHLRDRVKRLDIVAPVGGVVNGLMLRSSGDVIEPGAKIAEIIPDRDVLIAEVRVAPSDIGHVRVGDTAMIKTDTFDFGRYGGISGQVSEIAANATIDADGHPFFRARIRLDHNHVGPRGASMMIGTGMTIRADIKTGQKSLLRYLVRPVSNSLESAFSER